MMTTRTEISIPRSNYGVKGQVLAQYSKKDQCWVDMRKRVSRLLSNHHVPLGSKDQFYKMKSRLTTTYGIDYWAIKEQEEKVHDTRSAY